MAGAVDGTRHGGPRVLVVEDDPSVAALVPRVLKRLGGTCEAVATAEEALGRLVDGGWDLVITDLSLPGMDGMGLVREARRLAPEVRLLVLTGDIRARTATQALEQGADEVMAKPFQLDDLRKAVLRLTGDRAATSPRPGD